MLTQNILTLAAARQIIFAAETSAYRLACPCCISVVDMRGQMIIQVRMDGALANRVEESNYKALSAIHKVLEGKVHSNQILVGWEDDVIGTLKGEAGGIAIQSEDLLLGAIGISSGNTVADQVIALAGLDAYSSCKPYGRHAISSVQSLVGNIFSSAAETEFTIKRYFGLSVRAFLGTLYLGSNPIVADNLRNGHAFATCAWNRAPPYSLARISVSHLPGATRVSQRHFFAGVTRFDQFE